MSEQASKQDSNLAHFHFPPKKSYFLTPTPLIQQLAKTEKYLNLDTLIIVTPPRYS